MPVTKHTRVTSEAIKDATIAAVDIKDAVITEAKFSEHLEHGSITGVTATGRYKAFTTAYSAAPDVIITPIGAAAVLDHAPAVGSFMAKLTAAGTNDAYFVAWGAR